MEQIDFLAIYHKLTFEVVDGPFKGSCLFISEIDFKSRTVITKNGRNFPAELVAPLLREITDMGETEAALMYRKYWGKDPTPEIVEEIEFPWEKPKKPKPTKSHMMRIFEGRQYIAGDYEELMALVPYLIDNGFDIFGGAKKGWAKIKNRY
jgi:hypothetical protein